jgi:membrane protease YdiL (CAAX protease family)
MAIEQTNIKLENSKKRLAYLSPFIIIAVNCIVALLFGQLIGKWAFIPIILIEWCLFLFFIIQAQGRSQFKIWMAKPKGNIVWPIIAIIISLATLPIFIKHFELLNSWTIILPWLLIAFINPFLEEFYWRGFLLDYTSNWKNWITVIVTSFLFSANHFVFAINSDLFKGFPVFISTLIMGIIWAIVYKKTKSLRWTIFAHFLVDFLNLSVPSFLDMYKQGW